MDIIKDNMPTPSADEDGERYAERQRRYFDRVLALALGIGAGLLSSGASVSRVETAVKLICLACGAREVNVMSFPSVIICSVRLADGSDFERIGRQFKEAMNRAQGQAEQMENFMQDSRTAFKGAAEGAVTDEAELERITEERAASGEFSDDAVDREIEQLRKKIEAQI